MSGSSSTPCLGPCCCPSDNLEEEDLVSTRLSTSCRHNMLPENIAAANRANTPEPSDIDAAHCHTNDHFILAEWLAYIE